MRFFPLVAADDKPKGISVFYIICILFEMMQDENEFSIWVLKISPPCDSMFVEYTDWYWLVGIDFAILFKFALKTSSVINTKCN